MNEIKRCSLSGIGFTFEKDAYNRLNDYLHSLKEAYKESPDCEEILADIEARIAELILSSQSDTQSVVGMPLIENIVAQLGSAEDISGEEVRDNSAKEPRIPRRLYRDLENAKLGGVCAGLARHFDIEPVWIRLSLFVPLLLLFVGNIPYMQWCAILGQNLVAIVVIAYLVMWFAVPASKSARQKLEAEGEHISAHKIASRQSATDEERAKSSVASLITTVGRIFVILLKLFIGILLFPLIAFTFALLILTFATVTGMYGNISFNIGNFDSLAQAVGENGVGLMTLAFAFLLIPTLYIIYLFITLLLNKRPRLWVLLLALLLWIANIVGLVFAGLNFAEIDQEDEVVRILKYKDTNSLSSQMKESLDKELTEEERLEWEQLVNDANAQSIDKP